MHEAIAWNKGLVGELSESGEVMEGGCVNLMGTNESTEGYFGENWGRLTALKHKKLDAGNVFNHAQPSMLV